MMTSDETARPRIRCRHCGETNLLPISPHPSAPPLDPGTVDAVVKIVIDALTDGPKKTERIGERVKLIAFELRRDTEIAKLKQQRLAEDLGTSASSASRRLDRARGALGRIRTAIIATLKKRAP